MKQIFLKSSGILCSHVFNLDELINTVACRLGMGVILCVNDVNDVNDVSDVEFKARGPVHGNRS